MDRGGAKRVAKAVLGKSLHLLDLQMSRSEVGSSGHMSRDARYPGKEPRVQRE